MGTDSLRSSSDALRQPMEEDAVWAQSPYRATQTHGGSPSARTHAHAHARRFGHRVPTEQFRHMSTASGRGGEMATDSLQSSSDAQ